MNQQSLVFQGTSSTSNRLRIISAVLAGGVAVALIVWASAELRPKAIFATGGSEPAIPAIANGLKIQPGPQLGGTRIVPARAEGPSSSFFVGTGDGGNGFHTR